MSTLPSELGITLENLEDEWMNIVLEEARKEDGKDYTQVRSTLKTYADICKLLKFKDIILTYTRMRELD